jgi:hypothetical protein
MNRKTALLLLVAAAATLLSKNASAQDAQKMRLQLDTELFFIDIAKYDGQGDSDTTVEDTIIGIGPGSSFFGAFYYGYAVPQPMLGLGLGYTALENLAVGARLDLGFANHKIKIDDNEDPMKYRVLSYGFMPYLEIAFLHGSVRPFVGPTLGLEGMYGRMEYDPSTKGTTKMNLFVFGGTFGLRIMLSESASFDLSGLVTYGLGKSKGESENQDSQGVTTTDTSEADISRFEGAIKCGVSAWF